MAHSMRSRGQSQQPAAMARPQIDTAGKVEAAEEEEEVVVVVVVVEVVVEGRAPLRMRRWSCFPTQRSVLSTRASSS